MPGLQVVTLNCHGFSVATDQHILTCLISVELHPALLNKLPVLIFQLWLISS